MRHILDLANLSQIVPIPHYHYDQWLRYWMLGGPDRPQKRETTSRGRFSSKTRYANLLDTVFGLISKIVTPNAVVFVRTDRRDFTLNTTRTILRTHFPTWTMEERIQPIHRPSQTALFGDFAPKPGEVDLILTR